jgi:multidrug resistance efflux pump
MELLLMLTYAAICIAIFKLFRIPLNKWTVPTAVLGGIVIIGALVVLMNYNHPYSESVRQYYLTLPIVPQVRGRVVEIPVERNVLLKKGDVLFRIDPTPYQEKVDSVRAELEGARVERVNMKEELERSEDLLREGAGSEREVQNWQVKYDRANAQVLELEAKSDSAQFDLDSTEMRAPSDGFVTQLTLVEGMMAGITALSATMTYFPTQDLQLVGWFRQNSLLRITAGSEAEVAFDGFPGQIFAGKVDRIVPAIGEGQLVPQDELITFQSNEPQGRVAVLISLDEPPIDPKTMPIGLYGQAALYTEHAHHLAVMRKILLRMAGWLNYLFPFH